MKSIITLWTYRQGGSLVCDERKFNCPIYPTALDMEVLINNYLSEIDYDGNVMFDIFGISEGIVREIKEAQN